MKKIFFFLPLILINLLFFSVKGDEEPHPSLRQLIAKSKNETAGEIWVVGSPVKFEPIKVRKGFFGDEKTFLREVAILLQAGNDTDVWDAYNLVLFLDIRDETVSKILREKFMSAKHGQFFQLRLILLLARHLHKDNIDFLLEILKQSDHPPVFRVTAATCLSEIKYFESCLDEEQKKSILNALLSCLDDEKEFISQYSALPDRVGDRIAFLLGNLSDFASPALPTIKKKFSLIHDETNFQSVEHKLRLAWSIVRIAPKQCDELEYVLQKAVDYESKEDYETEEIRWLAIDLLETTPPILAEKVIPCLCIIIQKEPSHRNRLRAVESLKTILSAQENLAEHE